MNTKIKEQLELLPAYKFDIAEVIGKIDELSDDFIAGNYRFIRDNKIDEIMGRELLENEERLVNIPAWLIGKIVFNTTEKTVIEAIDEAKECKASKLLFILLREVIDSVVEELINLHGYTYQFGAHDEPVFYIDDYYVFRLDY